MVESANVAILRFGSGTGIQFATPESESILGCPAANLIGCTIDELPLSDAARADFREALRAVRDRREACSFQFAAPSPNGERHFQVTAAPDCGPEGTTTCVVQEVITRQCLGASRELHSSSRDASARQHASRQIEQLNEQLALRNQELYALYEIGTALAQSLQMRDIYWALFESVGQSFLNSPHFVVALYDEEKNEISCRFAIVDGEEAPTAAFPSMPLGEGPTSDAIRTGEIQIVDLAAEREKLARLGRVTQVGDERVGMSALYLPLVSGARVRGVLSFQSYERNAYDQVNRELISAIATHAAVTLANGLLYQKTQTHADTLQRHVQERTRELENLNERMLSILNNATDGILLLDQTGTIEVANRTFDTLFGYAPAELVGRSLLDITFDAHREELEQTIQRTRETGQDQHLQIKCLRKDRTTFDGELSLSPVTSHSQQEQYLVCTLFDISKFKAVERMKDQFISTVNHEIRTPITGILLSADTLSNYYERLSEKQRLRKIEQIRKQGQILVDLINAILDLAQLEARENQRGTELVDMNRLVTDVCVELREEAAGQQQTLRVTEGKTPLYLIGDNVDLKRIWRNLVGNAIKYTDQGGEITVSLEAGSAKEMGLPLAQEWDATIYAVGRVADTGRGIGEEDLPHLFTRFYRGWAKASRIPGTGLGLTMVREILERYEGGITVESTVGVGTTFTFWIPVA